MLFYSDGVALIRCVGLAHTFKVITLYNADY